MAQRRKNHLYLWVLGVCAAALLVDRCFLGSPVLGPAPSEAKEPSSRPGRTAAASATGASARDTADRALSIPELPFPRELPAIPNSTQLRDLFSRPRSAMRRPDGSDSAMDAVEPADEPRDRVKDFPQRHRLDGLLSDSGLKIAVVDGAWVRIGDKVDGCELASIEGTGAIFRCGDRETVLNLQPASASGPH